MCEEDVMKPKAIVTLLAAGVIVAGAWFVRPHNPVLAHPLPDKYAETLKKGLEFLVKSQHADGHWEGDGGRHPVVITAMAGLALMMEPDDIGDFLPPRPAYFKEARRAAGWLLA